MTSRRAFFGLVRDLAVGAGQIQAPVSEEGIEEPAGFETYVLGLRQSAKDVATTLGLPDVALTARQRCYADVWRQLVSHSLPTAELFVRAFYAEQGPNEKEVAEVYRVVHLMPAATGDALELGKELAARRSLTVVSNTRGPQTGDADRGLLDVSASLESAKNAASSAGRLALLTHFWHSIGQISGPKLVRFVNRFGLQEDPENYMNFDDYQRGLLQFKSLLRQLKQLVWLGAADRLLADLGGAPGGRATLYLLGEGVVPVNGPTPGTVELVTVR